MVHRLQNFQENFKVQSYESKVFFDLNLRLS